MPRVIIDKRARAPDAVLSLSAIPPVMAHAPAIRQWISEIAFDIWERRGRRAGDDLWNWLTAEKFVLAQVTNLRRSAAGFGSA